MYAPLPLFFLPYPSFLHLFPHLNKESDWILTMAGGGGWERRREATRTELNSPSSSNVPLRKTPALVGCCRRLPAWLYSICKCSVAKKSSEEAPAVSGGVLSYCPLCMNECKLHRIGCTEGVYSFIYLFGKCLK